MLRLLPNIEGFGGIPEPEAYQIKNWIRPTSTLAPYKFTSKSEVFPTWAPLPTLKFYFVLHQEVQLFLHLLYQSSNSIFDSNLQILSSTSIFKFYLRLQSSRFFRQIVISSYNETCWKSPTLNRRILAFFEKMSLARWFWAFFEKIVFDV